MPTSEAEWQSQVTDLATLLGWHFLHVRKAVGRRGGKAGWQTPTNISGWPDLELWHERHRCRVYAELKTDDRKSQATVEQLNILESMRRSGCRAEVWRPRDFEHVQAVLTSPFVPPVLELPNR